MVAAVALAYIRGKAYDQVLKKGDLLEVSSSGHGCWIS